MSPYVAFDNNPIYFVDPYGLASESGDGGPKGTNPAGGDGQNENEDGAPKGSQDWSEDNNGASETDWGYGKNGPIEELGDKSYTPKETPKPQGESLKVQGTKRDVRTFVRQVSKTIGNKFKVNSEGTLYNSSEKSNIETIKDKSGELSYIIGKAMFAEEVMTLILVRTDNNTLFDSYDYGTVDVGDFSKSSRIMQAGLFAHFLEERMNNPGGYAIPGNRSTYKYKNVAHPAGLKAESGVVNAMLGQPYVLVVQSADKNYSDILNQLGQVVGYYTVQTSTYGKISFSFRQELKLDINNDGGLKETGTILSPYIKNK